MTIKAAHYKSKKTSSHAGAFHLLQVVTIPEAARLFDKSEPTIRRALNRIPFRQSGTGSYLLSLPALTELYGQPRTLMEIYWILPVF